MHLYFIFGLLLSGLIGLSLGLIGGGGSIITVPVLVYVLKVRAHDAIGMSLAVVGGTSLVGSLLNYKNGTLQLKTGLIFGVAGIFGALSGSHLTHLLSSSTLMMIFSFLMITIALLMLRRKKTEEAETQISKDKPIYWKGLLAGFGVGILTGFLGVGGGFLIVPALVLFGGLTMKKAIGTSLFVIFLNCLAGLVGHMSQNHFDLGLTVIITCLSVIGALAGTKLAHKLASMQLQRGFAVFVLVIGIFIMAENFNSVFGRIIHSTSSEIMNMIDNEYRE